MTINELYTSFLGELSLSYNSQEASIISKLIFEHFGAIDHTKLIRNPENEADEKLISQVNASLSSLKNNKPVQYITGEAWFYKMKFKVSPAVLIPRPETEELAEIVIRSIINKPSVKIIDIGTGSGCIAIAIKKNATFSKLTAIDISASALAIAKENGLNHQAEIKFLQVDFLSEITWVSLEKYDVIVSNPPYIPGNEQEKLDKNVTAYEPHIALFVEDSRPLIFYEKIKEFGKTHLAEKGMVFLEIHQDLAEDVCRLFNNDHYSAEIKKDISGNDRMVIATKK